MGDAPAERLAFEVWGDPIEHSLSPRIHRAAYARLGWDWSYGRRRVDGESFTAELGDLDDRARGLSLTFPLKTAAFAAATTRDRTAELTGAVNTLVRSNGALHGYNTDVGGLVADIGAHGFAHLDSARIVGAGATATSALVALGDLGAERVEADHHDAGSARRAEDFKASFEGHVKEARMLVMRKLFAPMEWGFGRGGFSWGS